MVSIKACFLLLFGFFYVFNPYNFTTFNPVHLLFLFVVIYFATFRSNILAFISLNLIVKYLILVMVVFCYIIFSYLFSVCFYTQEALIGKLYVFFITFIEIPICAVFINIFIIRNNLFGSSIYRYVHLLITIQILMVILSLIHSDFRIWVISTSKIEGFENISNQFGLLRTFGLGSGLTYSLPMLVGLSSVVTFHLLISSKLFFEKSYWLLFFLFSILTVLLNAQTGMIPIIVYFIFSVIRSFFNLKIFLRLIFLMIIPWLFYVFSDSFSLSFNTDMFERTLMRLDDVILLLGGQVSGIFAELKEMHFLPKSDIEVLFGSGIDTLGNGSDIGYVRDINMFGVFGFLAILPVISVIYYYSFLCIKCQFNTFVALSLLLSMPFFYAKGMLFINNDVVNVMILIFVSYFVRRKQRYHVE